MGLDFTSDAAPIPLRSFSAVGGVVRRVDTRRWLFILSPATRALLSKRLGKPAPRGVAFTDFDTEWPARGAAWPLGAFVSTVTRGYFCPRGIPEEWRRALARPDPKAKAAAEAAIRTRLAESLRRGR